MQAYLDEGFVTLETYDDADYEVFDRFTAEEARTLAAKLLKLADELDALTTH
jgi:hypothetical protein